MRHLTVSAVTCFWTCALRYELSYRYRLKSLRFQVALIIGTAVHLGVELLAKGATLEGALAELTRIIAEAGRGAHVPEYMTPEEHDEKVNTAIAQARAMLRAWCDVYPPLHYYAAEKVLEGPLLSPFTGYPSTTFRRAGKTDGVVELEGLRAYELKTSTEKPADIISGVEHGIQLPTYEDMLTLEGTQVVGALVDVIGRPTLKRYQANKRRAVAESWADFEERCYRKLRDEQERFFRRAELPVNPKRIASTRAIFWTTAAAIRRCDREGYHGVKGPPPIAACSYCAWRRQCWDAELDGYEVSDVAHEELGIAA